MNTEKKQSAEVGAGQHDWKPNETLSAYRCSKCSGVAFAPHSPPKGGCLERLTSSDPQHNKED